LFLGSTSTHSGMTIASGTSHDGTIAFADGTSGDAEYKGYIQYNHTNNAFSIGTNGVEAMHIDSSGHLIVPQGITLGTAVGTYAAANTLDDYEESVFVLTVNQGGISINTDYDEAFYTKVGRLVTVSGLILATSSGDSNVLKINLPFVAATRSANQTDYFIGSVMSYNVPTGTGGLVPYIAVNTDKLVFQKVVDNGVWSSIVGTELASGDHFYFTITYQTN
jgi:hypothetical protein